MSRHWTVFRRGFRRWRRGSREKNPRLQRLEPHPQGTGLAPNRSWTLLRFPDGRHTPDNPRRRRVRAQDRFPPLGLNHLVQLTGPDQGLLFLGTACGQAFPSVLMLDPDKVFRAGTAIACLGQVEGTGQCFVKISQLVG